MLYSIIVTIYIHMHYSPPYKLLPGLYPTSGDPLEILKYDVALQFTEEILEQILTARIENDLRNKVCTYCTSYSSTLNYPIMMSLIYTFIEQHRGACKAMMVNLFFYQGPMGFLCHHSRAIKNIYLKINQIFG